MGYPLVIIILLNIWHFHFLFIFRGDHHSHLRLRRAGILGGGERRGPDGAQDRPGALCQQVHHQPAGSWDQLRRLQARVLNCKKKRTITNSHWNWNNLRSWKELFIHSWQTSPVNENRHFNKNYQTIKKKCSYFT